MMTKLLTWCRAKMIDALWWAIVCLTSGPTSWAEANRIDFMLGDAMEAELERARRQAKDPTRCPTCGQPDVAVDGGPVGKPGGLAELWDWAEDMDLVEPMAEPPSQRLARLFPTGPAREQFHAHHDAQGRYVGPIAPGMRFEWADPMGLPTPIQVVEIDTVPCPSACHHPDDVVVRWTMDHPDEWPDWPEIQQCSEETLRADAWRIS